MNKLKSIISKKTLWNEGEFNATYSSASRIRVIHTMIPRLITSWSKTYCYFRTKLVGWILLLLINGHHWRKEGPFEAILESSNSLHSMCRTYGPRDMISLVIPRVGDNRPSCEGVKPNLLWYHVVFLHMRYDWCIITMMSVPYIENIWWPSMKGCIPWIIKKYFIIIIYLLYILFNY